MADSGFDFSKLFGGAVQNDASFGFAKILSEYGRKDGSGSKDDVADADVDGDDDGQDWKSRYSTLLTEFADYRRRVEESKKSDAKNTFISLVSDFLDVADYVSTYCSNKSKHGLAGQEDLMLLEKVHSFLGKHGIEEMPDQSGKPFDHNVHDAILVDHSGMFEKDTVTMTLFNGYTLDGKVIRHPRVCVAGEPSNQAASA